MIFRMQESQKGVNEKFEEKVLSATQKRKVLQNTRTNALIKISCDC